MPTTLETGQLEPVANLCERITGRRPSPATVWRWTRKGTAAGILRTQKVFGALHTTEAEFRRWAQAGRDAPTGHERDDDQDDVTDEQLAEAGIL